MHMLPAKAIEVCRANKWLKTRPYVRANGRHCADICVTDPVTGSRTSKTVSSLSEEKYRNKRDAAEENLCEEIWDSALKILLGGGELTLIDYLQYDAEYLHAKKWSNNYSQTAYNALQQLALSMDAELPSYRTAADVLPLLEQLGVGRKTELSVLHMLVDIFDRLISLGLYVDQNPLATYYAAARTTDNKKVGQPRSKALPPAVIAAIGKDYRVHFLDDARYLSIKLRALGLSCEIISALDFGHVREMHEQHTLLIAEEISQGPHRQVRKTLCEHNEWAVRLLPLADWLWQDLCAWRDKYTAMGLSDLEKIPICGYGCRATPKRCSAKEIEEFLCRQIARHTAPDVVLRPPKAGASDTYSKSKISLTSAALHESFLAVGHDMLQSNQLSARYILGQRAATVDERVYIDYTAPRIQRRMNHIIVSIIVKMGWT